jgi:hypothetical protein
MLLTIPQAADNLDLSRQRVWLLVTTGRIKAQRIGQAWFITERELEKFNRRRNGAGRPKRKDRGDECNSNHNKRARCDCRGLTSLVATG